MAKIKPFTGIIYNLEKVDIAQVVCPPYDIISQLEQEELYQLSEYNVVRLELGKEFESDNSKENKYQRAKRFFEDWLKREILVKDQTPSFYIYTQEYLDKEGALKERIGLVSLVKLEDFTKKVVFPHEETMSKPKKDRLELLRTVQANISPIFGLYQDEGRAINNILKSEIFRALGPCFEFSDPKGVKHSLWKISDFKLNQTIQEFFQDKQILLADGHHRYETALIYRDLMKKESPSPEAPWNYVMMTLVNINESPTIYGYHRLVRTPLSLYQILSLLQPSFEITKLPSLESLRKKLNEKSQSLGLYLNHQFYWLLPKEGALKSISSPHPKYLELGSFLAQELILKKLEEKKDLKNEDFVQYTDDLQKAIESVNKGKFSFLLALNPVNAKTIWELAQNGLRLPVKTSYFYPKLWTGLVMRTLD